MARALQAKGVKADPARLRNLILEDPLPPAPGATVDADDTLTSGSR
jgi:hypothetical protein